MSQHPSPFDAIRCVDENGNEYWSARELSKLLGYDRWENFRRYMIPRTQKAFENSEHAVSDHLRGTTKMIKAGKEKANQTHFEIGKIVRKAIEEAGGTMPEDLPTPEKSIQELQRKEQKRIESERQPSLFEALEEREE